MTWRDSEQFLFVALQIFHAATIQTSVPDIFFFRHSLAHASHPRCAMATSSSSRTLRTSPGRGRGRGRQFWKYPPGHLVRMPWPGTRSQTFPAQGLPGDWQSTVQAAADIGLASTSDHLDCF